MDQRAKALAVLQNLLDSFPNEETLGMLQPDAGPGYRFYASKRLSETEIRSARRALEFLTEFSNAV